MLKYFVVHCIKFVEPVLVTLQACSNINDEGVIYFPSKSTFNGYKFVITTLTTAGRQVSA